MNILGIKNRRKRLFREVYPFFTIFFILLISLFIAFVYLYNKSKVNEISSSINLEASKVIGEFNNINIHTEYMMNLINLQIKKRPNDKAYIRDTIQKYKTHPELANQLSWTIFSWVNKYDFLTVDAEQGILKMPINMSSRKYIKTVKTNVEKLELGDARYGSTSDKWMIAGGVGLEDDNANYLGAITIGFEIKVLLSKLRAAISNSNVEVYLLDNDLNILTEDRSVKYQDFNFKIKDKSFLDNLRLLNSSGDKGSLVVTSLFKPKSNYGIYQVTNQPYLMVLRYHDAEFSSNLWINYLLRIVEILAIFLVCFSALIFLYKKERNLRYQSLLSLVAEKKKHSRSIFSSIISYDIKVSVGCINQISKMLQDKSGYNISKNEELELLQNIQESAEDLLSFTDDLIDIQKLGNGNFQLKEKEGYEIKDLIAKSTRLLKGETLNRSVSITTKVARNATKIKCDDLRMKQILVNLLTIILANSREGSEIKVEVKKIAEGQGNKILILIKNSTFKINDEFKDILQKDLTISDLEKKDGCIELSVAKSLIALHRGSLDMILDNKNGDMLQIKI